MRDAWVMRDALAKIGVNNPPLVAGLLTTLSEDRPTSILVGAYCDRSLAAVIPVAVSPVAVPTIVAVPVVITVPPVVTVATVTVSRRHDDTTAQQGAQERKDENAFHTNIHFGLLLDAHALRAVKAQNVLKHPRAARSVRWRTNRHHGRRLDVHLSWKGTNFYQLNVRST